MLFAPLLLNFVDRCWQVVWAVGVDIHRLNPSQNLLSSPLAGPVVRPVTGPEMWPWPGMRAVLCAGAGALISAPVRLDGLADTYTY